MYLNLPNGREIESSDVNYVKNYLEGLKREVITTRPDEIAINGNGLTLSLIIEGKTIPIRTSFLRKLLKWFNFPIGQIRYFDIETVESIMNDYLLNIKSNTVDITLENGEALTITSEKFGKINDIELIKLIEPLGISKIIKNDFMTSIVSETKEVIEPIPDDKFGVGISLFNSETGFRALSINSYLLRYICKNGAYVRDSSESKKYYHYDLNVMTVMDEVEKSIKSLNEKKDEIKERIKMLKSQSNFENTKKRVADLLRMKIGKYKADKLFEDTRGIRNNYDLFNHITLKAKDFELSTKIVLEEVAGDLLFFN
jgi:hypothetical protein